MHFKLVQLRPPGKQVNYHTSSQAPKIAFLRSMRSAADAGATEGGREITDKNKAAVHAAAAGFFRGAGL